MHFTRSDSLKFFIYTTLFFLLFFGYNTASGPYYETTYDSASIFNQELSVEAPTQEQSIESPSVSSINSNRDRKNIPKDPLTIAFNPDYVKIDNNVVERLREVIRSPYLRSKVTPLNLVLDSERTEPRGQVVGNRLILSTSISNDSEELKVLVHELGHIVDIFYLKK